LISFTRLGIPIIATLIVGGLISFILVFNFYPEKHENVQVDGKCFELKGAAHNTYNHLLAQSKKNYLENLTSKITDLNSIIPVTFTGQNSEIYKFIDKHDITVTSKQNVIFYPNINGSVIIGNVPGTMLSSIINDLSVNDLVPSSKSIPGSISIMPNPQLMQQDFKNASLLRDQFVQTGLRTIVKNSDDATEAECRYQPDHPDNIS
jgi:hypothetical protein